MLKIGVLGAGYLGKIHISQLKEISSIQLTGFYDPDKSLTEEVAMEYTIKPYHTEDELINSCEAVDIVANTTEHFRLAKKCIEKGKHIFIEKPVTETVEQAKELLFLAEKHHVKVQVGHVERFNPAFQAAIPFNLKPLFIESHRLSEFNPRGTDVSVVLDLMIHDIDVVMHIVKSPIKHISASGVTIVSGNPDIANARIEFENGCVANLTASRISLKKERKMRIFQHGAYILIDFLNKVTERFSLADSSGDLNTLSFVIDTGSDRKIVKMDKPAIPTTNAIKYELEAFVSAITGNTSPIVTLQDGHDSLAIAFQIIDQIKTREARYI